MSKNVVILGGGESGVGAALLAKAKGYNTFLSDIGTLSAQYKDELISNSIDFEENAHSEQIILSAGTIVKSPGIPDTAPIVLKALTKGIEVVSEIEFGARHTNKVLIGISGTNGKTTTTMLTYHLLKEGGINVGLTGNVGHSLAREVVHDNYDCYVTELSSFQLDGMYSKVWTIGALLNITPDHLDRYDYELNNYIQSKFRMPELIKKGGAFMYNANDPLSAENIARSNNCLGSVLAFNDINGIAWGNGDNLVLKIDGKEFEINSNELPLKGKHNLQNMMVAVSIALKMNVGLDRIKAALVKFEAVEHRLEKVAVINGATYYNDSKATNVDATYYALESFGAPIVWIAGGVDKGNDYEILKKSCKANIVALVALGVNNEKLLKAFDKVVPKVYSVSSMKDAVRISGEIARPGDVVLLSPACASFDLFKNYIDRGNQFKLEVGNLTKVGSI